MIKPSLEQRKNQQLRPASEAIVMYQKWHKLLFLHWEVDAAMIQRTLPPGLTVDTYEGKAFIGFVPFFMRGIRPRFVPPVPGISNFLEANVRTYVYSADGTPGVWFYSLDANQWLAVKVARQFFRLPYMHAKMSAEETDGFVDYQFRRQHSALDVRFRYRGVGETVSAEPGSLNFFLAERYILFAYKGGQLYSGQVHHTPYQLSSAELTHHDTHLFTLDGFPAPNRPPDSALYSPGVDVDVYSLKPVPT